METTSSTADQILAGLRAGRTLAEIAADLGLDLVDDHHGYEMIAEPGYVASCDGADVPYDTADSAQEAADSYVADGDWGDDQSKTSWVPVQTWRTGWRVTPAECASCTAAAIAHDEDGDLACARHAATPAAGVQLQPLGAIGLDETETESEEILVEIPAVEPDCIDGHDHDWQSPVEIVGGIHENPGVWGHGGGVLVAEVCIRCGCGQHTDTWAQDPASGQQGLRSVEYRPGEYADQLAGLVDDADLVDCSCGETSDEPCPEVRLRSDLVTIEWMPEHLRASHEAAGNSGTYPENGAVRLCVARSCADRLLEQDAEWTREVHS